MTLLIIQLIFSATFSGLVLLVQLTHYPSFIFIDKDAWTNFHSFHSSSISIMAMPLMIGELALATYNLWVQPTTIFLLAFALVLIIWLNTFLQAVPLHQALSDIKDEKKISKLVKVNIIRTIASIIRTILLAYILTL